MTTGHTVTARPTVTKEDAMPAGTITAPRTCPRCRGPLHINQDWAGTYSSCFICGYAYEWGALLPATQHDGSTETAPPAPRQRRRSPSHGLRRL